MNNLHQLFRDILAPYAPEETDMPKPADVIKVSNIFTTEYHIRGSAEAVRKAVDMLLREYHPLGYGTRATFHEPQYATVWRANSCD